MATKAKKTPKPDRWATEAAMQALLKYGPEESGLKQLQDDALSTYKTTVAQARGGAEGTIGAIDAARPQVAAIYDPTLAKVGQTQTLLGQDLARLGPAADAFKGGAASEAATQVANIGRARTSALAGLVEKRVAARAGVQFATENARRQLAEDLTKILTRKQDLKQEKGTFAALTAAQLQDAADKLASQEAIAAAHDQNALTIAQGHDTTSTTNTQARIEADAAKDAQEKQDAKKGTVSATGVKLLTGDAHASAASSIGTIESRVKQLLQGGVTARPAIIKKLRDGRPATTITVDPDTGAKLKNPIRLPAIPGYSVDAKLAAAIDMAQLGYITKATQRNLANAGYSIKRLGLTTEAQWRKAHPNGSGGLLSRIQQASRK